MSDFVENIHLHISIRLKSKSFIEINDEYCIFTSGANKKIHIITCNVNSPLNKEIQSITLCEENRNLQNVIILLQSSNDLSKITDLLWIKEEDKRIYILENRVDTDSRLFKFLLECIPLGFKFPEKVPPNIYNEEGCFVSTHITYLRDVNNRDLLMYAFEERKIDIFPILLQLNFKLDRRDFKGKLPIDYAACKLKELVHSKGNKTDIDAYKGAIDDLLCAGSPYPNIRYYTDYEDSPKVKELSEASEKMHNFIKENDIVEIRRLTEEFEKNRMFYDKENNSLMKFIINSKPESAHQFYELFNFQIGDHEEMELYEKVIVDYEKYFFIVQIILLKKFRYINGEHIQGEHLTCIKNALKSLNVNKICSALLYLCGANMRSNIFMDFDVEYYEDTKVKGKTYGITNTHGDIFIAAKNLMDETKKSLVLGAIAHELCHQAIYLAFWNNFNCYPVGASSLQQEYEKIFQAIENNIIENDEYHLANVFLYTEEYQRSELIVTIPQMIVENSSGERKIQEKYQELYKFMVEIISNYIKPTVPVLVRLQRNENPELTLAMEKKLSLYPDDNSNPSKILDNLFDNKILETTKKIESKKMKL